MASINKVEKGGKLRWRAYVRKRIDGKKFSKTRTFDTKKQADAWAAKIESQLANPSDVKRMMSTSNGVTLKFLIEWYIDAYKEKKGWQRSKQAHLEQLLKFDIALLAVDQLTSHTYIEHINQRLKTCAPPTANNDIVWIRVVIKNALAHFRDLIVDLNELEIASTYLHSNNMIGKAQRRDRRPTADEIAALSNYFKERDTRSDIKSFDIFWFALYSARRQAEITRLLWTDFDAVRGVVLVRDLKHPTRKLGNHKLSRLTRQAQEIIERQPRSHPEIFPFNPRTISSIFTRTCHILEIDDLRFHDLRHEGASRLFEQGYSITEVQQFTLHESWQELSRYTNLRPEDVKLKDAEELSEIRIVQMIKDDLHLPDLDLSDSFTLVEVREELIACLGSEIATDGIIDKYRTTNGLVSSGEI